MDAPRLLAIGLDGFEISLAERLIAEGRMPHLARLKRDSARFRLDHGEAKYTGLAWEHVSTGGTPEALDRFSAVSFDPARYHVSQDPTRHAPVFAGLASRTVLFDVPYCDIAGRPELRGVAHWGAHDPGVDPACNPPSLSTELAARFGRYPAEEHIYAMVWQSPARTRAAARALAKAVRVRKRAAAWLLEERLPDWEFAMVVVSEPHSAIEPLWHGVDPTHPCHALPSAQAAREGLERVYIETDRLIGRLRRAAPDAALAVFAMHGMGANGADVPAMALLPELLYRHQFGKPYMRELPWAGALPSGMPLLAPDQDWHREMAERVPHLFKPEMRKLAAARERREDAAIEFGSIDWQPAARYRVFWPDMEAFALPSFYDGRVRVNMIGRERYGRVSPNRHHVVLDTVRTLLEQCRDCVTGAPVVEGFRENATPPGAIGPTEADLYIHWKGIACGFDHPELGRIGPLPLRRTGGHSGPEGFLFLAGGGFAPGARGRASSFDVVPTLFALRGEETRPVSGRPLVPEARAARSASRSAGSMPARSAVTS